MSSTNKGIMEHLIGNQNFALVDTEFVLKVAPKLRMEKFVAKIEELIVEGKIDDAIMLLSVLKNPDVFVFRGAICQANNIMSTQRIEQFMQAELERKMKTEGRQESIQRAYEILIAINAELSIAEKLQLMQQQTAIWIVDEGEVRPEVERSRYRVTAVRYIPTYVVEAIDNTREGRWQFPECYVGVNIDVAQGGLAISPTVFVVSPRDYLHPFVFQGNNKMCLGSGASKVQNQVSTTSNTYRIIKTLLDAGEQVLKSGYNKPSNQIAPANGHIWDPKFNKRNGYPTKIGDRVSPEFRELLQGTKATQRKAKSQNGSGSSGRQQRS